MRISSYSKKQSQSLVEGLFILPSHQACSCSPTLNMQILKKTNQSLQCSSPGRCMRKEETPAQDSLQQNPSQGTTKELSALENFLLEI